MYNLAVNYIIFNNFVLLTIADQLEQFTESLKVFLLSDLPKKLTNDN